MWWVFDFDIGNDYYCNCVCLVGYLDVLFVWNWGMLNLIMLFSFVVYWLLVGGVE